MSRGPWHSIETTCLREAGEAIEYGLMEAGALGTESRDAGDGTHIIGYYGAPVAESEIRTALLDALRIYNFPSSSLIDLKVSEVADRDWLAEWKKDWQPVEVGRFIVAPPWIESEPGAVATGPSFNRIVIRIEPGMAFGTGTHETTRLCLKAIEKYYRGGSFLDVGTGTGVLAIAAAKMFPEARVEACDTDAAAVQIACENAQINGVGGKIIFRVGTVEEQTSSADFVCANLKAPVIVDLLPLLLGTTCGRLVLSGILDSQIELVEANLRELGTAILESEQDGEWVALII